MAKLIIGLGNRCLDVAGSNSSNGSSIILWDQHGGTNQLWTLTSEGYIESSLAPGKCLDIQSGAAANGTPIILFEKTGGANQKWRMEANGNITSLLDENKCLDASGADNRNGTPIVLWDKNNGLNQKWIFQDFTNYLGNASYPDGTLLKATNPAIFVLENGQRRLVPDEETFLAMGYIPGRVLFISDSELNKIPLGTQLPRSVRLAISMKTDLKDNRWMESTIRLLTATGQLTGTSRTRSGTWLNGFKGAAIVLGTDNNDDVIFARTQETYANGTLIGGSDNTSFWQDSVDTSLSQRTKTLTIIHGTREATNINKFVDGLVANGMKLSEAAAKIAPLVKDADTKSS